jgi:hypothetical protein
MATLAAGRSRTICISDCTCIAGAAGLVGFSAADTLLLPALPPWRPSRRANSYNRH